MRTPKNLLIAFFLLLTRDAVFAASAPVTCGSTLILSTYTLAADLDCSKATAPITVRDRAVLNLNSHVYAGQIILDGSLAQLKEGTINCSYQNDLFDEIPCGVVVQGAGNHILQNVTILYPAADPGIEVISTNNFLISNTVFSSGELGAVVIWGNNNTLLQNRAVLNSEGGIGSVGFFIVGNANQLTGNYARLQSAGYLTQGDNNVLDQNVHAGVPDDHSVTDEGFGIAGSGNRLTRNVVTNEDFGIFVFTQSNTIENNIAIRNGVDLLDGTKNCDSNIWQKNIFQTSNQTCIGGTTVLLASTNALEKLSALLHRVHLRHQQRAR
jgi:parallel beta-helix repeat protein